MIVRSFQVLGKVTDESGEAITKIGDIESRYLFASELYASPTLLAEVPLDDRNFDRLSLWLSSNNVLIGELTTELEPSDENLLDNLTDYFLWNPVDDSRIQDAVDHKGSRHLDYEIASLDLEKCRLSPFRYQLIDGGVGSAEPIDDALVNHIVMRDKETHHPALTEVCGTPVKLNRKQNQSGTVTGHSCYLYGHGDDVLMHSVHFIIEALAALSAIKAIRQTISQLFKESRTSEELADRLVDARVHLSSLIESASPDGIFMVDTRPYAFAREVWLRMGMEAHVAECEAAITRLSNRLDMRLTRYEAMQARSSQRTSIVIGILTAVLLPATLWFGFLGANVKEMTVMRDGTDQAVSLLPPDPVVWISFLVFLCFGVVLGLLIGGFRRSLQRMRTGLTQAGRVFGRLCARGVVFGNRR